jgi:hypothetical protein
MRIFLSFLIFTAGCGGDDLLLPGSGDNDGPVELRRVSGSGQTAVAGDPVRHPLVVEALDRDRQPVAGTVVIFAFVDPPNGAEVAPGNDQTDTLGLASAEVTLGNAVGDQQVEARLADPASTLSVQFLLTALAPNDDEGGGGGGGGGGNGGGNGNGNGGGPGHGGGDDDDD